MYHTHRYIKYKLKDQ